MGQRRRGPYTRSDMATGWKIRSFNPINGKYFLLFYKKFKAAVGPTKHAIR